MSQQLDLILPAPPTENSGLYEVPASVYHADFGGLGAPSLSKSVAHILLTKSPAHARVAHPKLNPDYVNVEKDIFDIGTVVHALLLEGEAGVSIVEKSDWKTNEAKEAKQAARDKGIVPLLAKDWDRCEKMVNAARRQLEMLDLDPAPFTNGKAEQTLVWDDNGVNCRARFDWIHDDLSAVDDYKSTGLSADPNLWGKTMFRMGADLQAAFYLRGLRLALGVEPQWRFVVQETFAPYALSVVTPAPEVIAHAELKAENAIDTWRRCLADNHWPGYTRELGVIELPAWLDWTPDNDFEEASDDDECPF